MNIFTHFRNILFTDIESIYPKTIESDDVKVEFPNNPEYGDLSSNIGIIIAKKIKANPKDIAEKYSKEILMFVFFGANQYLYTISGPG